MTDAKCPDCEVNLGEEHQGGCDTARCAVTGLQRLTCDEDHDCGRDTWQGRSGMPGLRPRSAAGVQGQEETMTEPPLDQEMLARLIREYRGSTRPLTSAIFWVVWTTGFALGLGAGYWLWGTP